MQFYDGRSRSRVSLIMVNAIARSRSRLARARRRARGGARAQCFPFTGIGPAAESNPATIRIKYGINPGISGICPIPAAESKVGYIPLFWRATVAWSRGARAPLAKRGRSPWPVRRLGAFAQRGRAHCTSWASCRELFGLFRAKRAILSLHAGGRCSQRINLTQAVSR